jgi:transposase-like protein
VPDRFRGRFPRLAPSLDEAEADLLAYPAFPPEQWRQIWRNNPLEPLSQEIKRRTDVVRTCPKAATGVRLVGAVLAERRDEWQVCRRYVSDESQAKLEPPASQPMPELLAAG